MSVPASDPQTAFTRFLPEAQKIPAKETVRFNTDAQLALKNASLGTAALLARESDVKKELPKLSLTDVRGVPDLAHAVAFAANRVDRSSDGTTKTLLKEAAELRHVLLAAARLLAATKLVAEKRVAAIEAGHGPIDAAQDLVDLAALFHDFPKAQKATPITNAQLKRAGALGTELLTRLHPKGTPGKDKVPADAVAAARERDQLWTLLLRRYERVRAAGVWLWTEAGVDAHAPALNSRHHVKARPKPAAASPPTGTKAT